MEKIEGIEIQNWISLGSGRYRFYGTDQAANGFLADARLKYQGAWHATVELTNFSGGRQMPQRALANYAEGSM